MITNKTKFEVGKVYMHTSGKKMKIIGVVESVTYGVCYVAENGRGDFLPIGMSEEHAENWEEA